MLVLDALKVIALRRAAPGRVLEFSRRVHATTALASSVLLDVTAEEIGN
jgi:hypothetical protein